MVPQITFLTETTERIARSRPRGLFGNCRLLENKGGKKRYVTINTERYNIPSGHYRLGQTPVEVTFFELNHA